VCVCVCGRRVTGRNAYREEEFVNSNRNWADKDRIQLLIQVLAFCRAYIHERPLQIYIRHRVHKHTPVSRISVFLPPALKEAGTQEEKP
jgi:hypothetical protein